MNRKILFTFIGFLFFQNLIGQSPCGTPSFKNEWYRHYLEHRQDYEQYRGGTTLYVPLNITLLGTNSGAGYYPLSDLLPAVCQLNADFSQVGIQFFIYDTIRYINNTSFYAHPDIVIGAQHMLDNNLPNVMNSYIVSDPAGNCGYNIMYAGNMMAKSCMTGHTWAHEVGHYFNLAHPFLGWEKKNYDYNVPTPDTVLFDYTNFLDTLWGYDTTIIDTTEVELVDRSNCLIAADGFCDTQADYISYRWQCDAQNNSPLLQKDPNGVDFHSDGSLIMSYSYDECQSRFSNDQAAMARSYLQTVRSSLLWNQNPLRDSVGLAALAAPADGSIQSPGTIPLSWQAPAYGTNYIIQISRNSSFSILLEEGHSSTNSYTPKLNFTTLPNPSWRYYWRVLSYNPGYTCGSWSSAYNFDVEEGIGTHSLTDVESFVVSPNPINAETGILNLEFYTDAALGDTEFIIFNNLGQKVFSQIGSINSGMNFQSLSIPHLTAGIYSVQLKNQKGLLVRKFIVE